MSSCINKKTVHKQGVKWADWVFKMSQRSGRVRSSDGAARPTRRRFPDWETLLSCSSLGSATLSCDGKSRELCPNRAKVAIKAHFENSRAANVSPPAWKSCFSSKTFWNYETNHQIRMDDKKPFQFRLHRKISASSSAQLCVVNIEFWKFFWKFKKWGFKILSLPK